MYSLEEITSRIEKVIRKEKLDEETTRKFFTLLKTICEELLNPEEESKTQTPIPNDLDELIKSRVKKEKADPTKLSISFFLEGGFDEVLDVKGNYFGLRTQLLEHSKILKPHPKSLDFLVMEMI